MRRTFSRLPGAPDTVVSHGVRRCHRSVIARSARYQHNVCHGCQCGRGPISTPDRCATSRRGGCDYGRDARQNFVREISNLRVGARCDYARLKLRYPASRPPPNRPAASGAERAPRPTGAPPEFRASPLQAESESAFEVQNHRPRRLSRGRRRRNARRGRRTACQTRCSRCRFRFWGRVDRRRDRYPSRRLTGAARRSPHRGHEVFRP